MNNILITILIVGFLIRTVRNTLSLVSFWQLKEYRFDRVWVHLRETRQGQQLIFGRQPVLKWLLILIYPITFINVILNNLYPILVLITFIREGVAALGEINSKTLKRPIFTFKASSIIASALFLQFFLLNFPLFDIFFWVLVLDKLLPLFITILVLSLSLPTELVIDKKIIQAAHLIRRHKKLLVIGVTGSYGKSSTKECIARVLEETFSVLKTPGTNNTPIGIANTILSGLKKNTQVFVVEMGAYKKGEIARMCEIVRPNIGVLTGISPQHLSLFGSLKNTMDAKYELIEALPRKKGLAIFNGNNNYCREFYKKTALTKLIYSFGKESDVKISNIKVHPFHVVFRAKINGEAINFKANLLGRHNIENLLPAILVARHLGMNTIVIKRAIERIPYMPMTMKPIRGDNGAIFVDDTFNASPDSVLAAIEYMKVFRGKKIMVLQPMIELGKEARGLHHEIGMAAEKFLTKVYLTNKNFFEDFQRGVRDTAGRDDLIEVIPLEEITTDIQSLTGRGDVIVFEGKESAAVLKRILL